MNEHIIVKLAKKYNLPEEQINLVIQSFFNGLRHYLVTPLESKGGIILHDLMTFYINRKRLLTTIDSLNRRKDTIKPDVYNEQLEFFTNLLNNTYKYERQTIKQDEHK